MRPLTTVLAVSVFFACDRGGPSPEAALRREVIDFNGHVIVMKKDPAYGDFRDVVAAAREQQGVVSAAPFLFVEGTLRARGKEQIVGVKGIAPEATPVARGFTPSGVLAGYRPPPRSPHRCTS